MTIEEKLMRIQSKLVAPKNQYNSFGKYKYRSCEDILEGLKPLLAETKTCLTINDDIVPVGDRIYVKATATLHDCESTSVLSNTAFAREEDSKKGMDGSQITGTASSYARKYSLSGLFAIDDTKDADTENYKVQQNNAPDVEKESEKAAGETIDSIKIQSLTDQIAKDHIDSKKLFALYKVTSMAEITNKKFTNMIQNWEKIKKQCPAVNEGDDILFGNKR